MKSPIRTYNLTKTFRHTTVLEDLCLEVPEGSIYGLVGPNGAGKTTTIKVLMNMLRPVAGRSEVLGTDSVRLSPREFAQIGYVSENQEMPEWMTVGYFMDYWRHFLSYMGSEALIRPGAPVRSSREPQTAPSLPRYAHEGRTRVVARVPAEADRP